MTQNEKDYLKIAGALVVTVATACLFIEIGGTEIATGLSYSQQIASGDYAGWGFELESGVLKFKQLA